MFVALKDSLFRFDAGVLSLNSSYSFVLRVAKDRRASFFIQRVQPIASNFTSLDEVGSQLDALLASGDNDAVLFVAGRASEELNNVVSISYFYLLLGSSSYLLFELWLKTYVIDYIAMYVYKYHTTYVIVV